MHPQSPANVEIRRRRVVVVGVGEAAAHGSRRSSARCLHGNGRCLVAQVGVGFHALVRNEGTILRFQSGNDEVRPLALFVGVLNFLAIVFNDPFGVLPVSRHDHVVEALEVDHVLVDRKRCEHLVPVARNGDGELWAGNSGRGRLVDQLGPESVVKREQVGEFRLRPLRPSRFLDGENDPVDALAGSACGVGVVLDEVFDPVVGVRQEVSGGGSGQPLAAQPSAFHSEGISESPK